MTPTPEEVAVSSAMPVEDADRIVSAACDELLDQFVRQSERHMRKLGDALYEDLLISVQEHLKRNANWNLANEIERCRRAEAENRAAASLIRSQAKRIKKLERALREAELFLRVIGLDRPTAAQVATAARIALERP